MTSAKVRATRPKDSERRERFRLICRHGLPKDRKPIYRHSRKGRNLAAPAAHNTIS